MPVIKQIQVDSPCSTAFSNCAEVALCLTEEWRDRTTCGYAYARAKVIGVGFRCGDGEDCCPQLTAGSTLYSTPPLTGEFTCVYTVEIDREAEFLVDPGSALSEPYDITSDDVTLLVPYACAFDELYHAVKTLPDHVIDHNNIVEDVDELSKRFIVTFPIIDRVNSTPQGSFSIDFSVLFDDTDTDTFSTLTQDIPTSTITFTPPVGAPTIVDMCDLIEACFDGATITRTGAGGTFEVNFPPVSTDSLTPYNPVTGSHTHTAVDSTAQDIPILSQTAGNVITYDDGVYLDCPAVAACVPAGQSLTAGSCVSIVADAINVNTSGVWGVGDLTYPCADTEGQSIYCDSNGDLRTAPPVAIFQFGIATFGAGLDPAPLIAVIGNGSSCRSAYVTGGYTAAFNYSAPSAAAGGPLLELSIDGAPSSVIAQMIGSGVGGGDIGGTYISTDFIDNNIAPIAPGATQLFTVDYLVQANGGSVSSFSVSMRGTVISI